MNFRFKILGNLSIGIKGSKDYIIKQLEEKSIPYRISYDKVNNGVKETIVAIIDKDISIEFKDEAIATIRMHDSDTNHIGSKGEHDGNPALLVGKIKDKIIDIIEPKEDIKLGIETLDTTSMKCRFILEKDSTRCRISSAKDNSGNIFISTIRLL